MKTFIVTLLLVINSFAFSTEINYNLSMPLPQNHYYHVEMEINDLNKSEIEVKMPVWSPGSYLIREFARFVDQVKATDKKGNSLEVKRFQKIPGKF